MRAAGAFLVGLAIAILWAGPTLVIVAAMAYVAFRGARFFVRRHRARRAAASFDPATAPGVAAARL